MYLAPKLSIITVCYNAEKEIGRTIRSALAQTFTDLEYLFIDGGSRDGTLSVIGSLQGQLEERGIAVSVVSEPDEGIYDAMNKGLDRATGEWVLMLNAGDALADPFVLSDIFGEAAYEEDVLYCDAVFRDVHAGKELFKPFPALPLSEMARGLPFCHQAAFAKGELLKRYPFDARFSICADYDQFLRAWMDGALFRYIPRVAAIFDCGGICLRRPLEAMGQCAQIRKYRHFSGVEPALGRKLKASLRNRVKRWAPGLFYSHRRGWRDRLPKDASGRVRGNG